jgi:hypothetical protein
MIQMRPKSYGAPAIQSQKFSSAPFRFRRVSASVPSVRSPQCISAPPVKWLLGPTKKSRNPFFQEFLKKVIEPILAHKTQARCTK